MTPRQHNELQRQADVIERNKEYKTTAFLKSGSASSKRFVSANLPN